MRPKTNPYEVWQSPDGSWTWAVLKKWQADDNKPFARWFCNVVSPFTPHGEMGDVYVSEIKSQASKVDAEALGDDATEQQRRDEKHGLYGGREDVAN